MDLFASRLTAQCPAFFSWRPDPYAVATDAFLQGLSQIKGYANPAWGLIGRVLSKVQMDRARIALVAPVWKTQPWYPLLLQMLIAIPCLRSDNAEQRSGGSRPSASRMAYLRERYRDQDLSEEATSLMLRSWKTKTNKSYNSLFGKWHSWCYSRGSEQFSEPIKKVVNFLAHLHEEGYQYRSLYHLIGA